MKKALVSVLLLFAFSFSFSQTFSLTDTTIFSGSCYRSYSIFFDLGKATLRAESYAHLDSVVTFLNNNPKVKLEIDVHSDSRSKNISSSTHLTMNRACSIRDYIVSKGIPSNRLVAKGYDAHKPLISDVEIKKLKTKDEIESAHQKNRRVEFTILAI